MKESKWMSALAVALGIGIMGYMWSFVFHALSLMILDFTAVVLEDTNRLTWPSLSLYFLIAVEFIIGFIFLKNLQGEYYYGS